MKKSILIPFLFMGLLAFASCKGTSENKSTTATDTVQAEKPQSGTIHLTRAEFLKKIADYENHSKEWKYLGDKADKPVLVDFYSDTCIPCKQMAGILGDIEDENEDNIYIYKVNVDKEPELARDFGIQSIPTIWFVPMKGEPQVNMGALSKEQLKGYIDKVLLKQ